MNNDKNDRSAVTILFGEAEKSADELHKKFSDGAKLTVGRLGTSIGLLVCKQFHVR